MNNSPKAYQQGWIEFYKLKFKVTPDVLIPRPETELLVDEVLNFAKIHTITPTPYPLTVLDLGTGSGAIAISIAKNLPKFHVGTRIIASEVSKEALEIAKQNAKLHQVEDKIEFIVSNLLEDISPIIHNTDPLSLVIVTNLPYIPTQRISYLDSSVKDFEPHIALDGGEDGFDLYRKLFAQIKEKRLKPKLILGEIDYTHGEIAYDEAHKYFPDAKVEVKKDLAKLQRILTIKF